MAALAMSGCSTKTDIYNKEQAEHGQILQRIEHLEDRLFDEELQAIGHSLSKLYKETYRRSGK